MFSVAAVGDEPLTFGWQKDGAPLADDGRITGASTSTLVITNIGLSDAGAYSALVINAFGTQPSQAALLTVTGPAVSPVPAEPGSVGFQFATVPGLTYVIERKAQLEDPDWQPVAMMTGTGEPMQFTRPTAEGSSFFRLRVE